MEEQPRQNTRRRSASVTAPSANTTRSPLQQPQVEGIPEAGEGKPLVDRDSDTDSPEDPDSSDYELDDMRLGEGLEDDEETGLTGNDRRKRRRRKRRNTRLDERIVGTEVEPTKREKEIAKQSFLRAAGINVILIGSWYLFSISISVYNKWMFSEQDDTEGETKHIFPFPLFTTCVHMIVQFTLAGLVLLAIPSFRPRHDYINPHHAPGRPQPRQEPSGTQKPLMTRWFYLTRIGPCGAATGLDIGLGNMSMRFISLTFYTMCKSSVLGFVLLFAFLFRLEKPSWRLGVIIVTMTIGVVMMVAGETAFNALGFILVMSAAASSGFRWSLTQILLIRNPATSNPFSSIFFLAPVMFFTLLVIALPVEGVSNVRAGLAALMDAKGPVLGIAILLFPGTLAFSMTASEFALLKRTSVVTLSICGIFKEVVTISVASAVFDDKLTPINVSGLVITIACIAAYNYIKIKKMREEARMEAHLAVDGYAPVLSTQPDRDRPVTNGFVPRPSTSGLIRNSLSIPATLPSDRSVIDSSARASPIKRPENLD